MQEYYAYKEGQAVFEIIYHSRGAADRGITFQQLLERDPYAIEDPQKRELLFFEGVNPKEVREFFVAGGLNANRVHTISTTDLVKAVEKIRQVNNNARLTSTWVSLERVLKEDQ